MKSAKESYKKVIAAVGDIKTTFNPFFIYYTMTWFTSKVLQWQMKCEKTIWEIGWNWFLDIFGS